MRKFCIATFNILFLSLVGIMGVDAREYTREDIQESLASTISIWQGTAPEGTQFNFTAVGNDLALKSTFNGQEYISHFVISDGVITFTSDRSSVTNDDEFLKSTFDNFNITFLLVGLLRMYDDETKESVKDVVVNDSLSMENFTLDRDGLTATLINSDIKEITLENGAVLRTEGFIRSIQIDFNHPNFIKFVIDNDGSLIFGSQKKVPTLNLKDVTSNSITLEIGNTEVGKNCSIYKKEENGEFTLLYTGVCSNQYTDTEVKPDTTYTYKVLTEDAVESVPKSAKTPPLEEVPTPPAETKVPSLNLTDIKMDSITVHFSNVDQSKTCHLYRGREHDPFALIKTLPCSEVYVDREVYANTLYHYKVEVDGLMSEPKSAKTLPKIIEPIPENPKTGILTYTLAIITLIIACIGGLQILGKNRLFKKL